MGAPGGVKHRPRSHHPAACNRGRPREPGARYRRPSRARTSWRAPSSGAGVLAKAPKWPSRLGEEPGTGRDGKATANPAAVASCSKSGSGRNPQRPIAAGGEWGERPSKRRHDTAPRPWTPRSTRPAGLLDPAPASHAPRRPRPARAGARRSRDHAAPVPASFHFPCTSAFGVCGERRASAVSGHADELRLRYLFGCRFGRPERPCGGWGGVCG